MKPSDKAKELIEKYKSGVYHHPFREKDMIVDDCQQCAIIAVEEIIKTYCVSEESIANNGQEIKYWNEVLTILKTQL